MWNQWIKYLNYFSKLGYDVDIVTKTWKWNWELKFYNYYCFNDIITFDSNFFSKYNFIVIAVNPYEQLELVLNFIYNKNLNNKIIIEKPVSYNINFLHELVLRDNYYFFIDELVLWEYFKKIFSDNSIINIFLYEKWLHYNLNILEHVFWNFLILNNFDYLLSNFKINFLNGKDKDYFFYELKSSKVSLKCIKGYFFLNNNLFYKLNFEKSISFLLWLSLEDNLKFKSNFLSLRKYLLNVFWYESSFYKK